MKKMMVLSATGLTAAMAIGQLVYAQGSAAGSGTIDPETGALPTFQQMFMFSPYINGAIAALSVIAVLLFVVYLLSISPRTMAPIDFIEEVKKLVLAKKYEAATDLCRANRNLFVATVIQRCCEHAGKDQGVIMDMIETEGKRRADMLWNRISYLADIANVAPMLGLLGTVVGMITAFFGLEKQTGSINSTILAQGVGQAMATTMFGLVVGIAATIFYTIVKGRATRTLAEAEQAIHTVADHIKPEVEVAGGGKKSPRRKVNGEDA